MFCFWCLKLIFNAALVYSCLIVLKFYQSNLENVDIVDDLSWNWLVENIVEEILLEILWQWSLP